MTEKWKLRKKKKNHLFSDVTRVEIISQNGREFVLPNCRVKVIDLQDNDKTMKVFVDKIDSPNEDHSKNFAKAMREFEDAMHH